MRMILSGHLYLLYLIIKKLATKIILKIMTINYLYVKLLLFNIFLKIKINIKFYFLKCQISYKCDIYLRNIEKKNKGLWPSNEAEGLTWILRYILARLRAKIYTNSSATNIYTRNPRHWCGSNIFHLF